ncbi:sensor histidine kinase [Austwickia chelonae]|uniref:sensor histidine kinase n=1 Tax=Austwickia chelonae TaxID=100225 RepID=UPI000E26C4A2|nr:histidine kinase [Austwickia chelonae]
MSLTCATFKARLRIFFAIDDDWQRPPPGPRQRRNDRWIAVAVWAFAAFGMELVRSWWYPDFVSDPRWLQHLLIAAGTLPLIWRRSYPLLTMGYLQLHMFLCAITVTSVMATFPMQCVYIFALCSGLAWARSRRAAMGLSVAVLVLMFGSLTWQFAVGTAFQQLLPWEQRTPRPDGLFSDVAAYTIYTFLVNIVYFGSGILGGQAAWHRARGHAQLEAQAALIAAQADELADRKVVEERLRIARELHDVVAHHVSVMGVQAAAARRVMGRDPASAEAALGQIEVSSRQAVGEMRGLLGTLRRADTDRRKRGLDENAAEALGAADPGTGHRAPQPGVEQIAELVHASCTPGFSVTYQVVDDGKGTLDQVPMPIGLSLYRTVQEALANVRRHSTSPSATVVLRVGDDSGRRYVEAEILDQGRPRGGTSGSGLGLLGMRERVASHGGTSEIGPRATGGYRVRVRLPLNIVPRAQAPGPPPSPPAGASTPPTHPQGAPVRNHERTT